MAMGIIDDFEYGLGDKVEKIGGDYDFRGVIVAGFTKTTGAQRYVVENQDGILHIFSAKNLKYDTTN